jgi:hypothetical protein
MTRISFFQLATLIFVCCVVASAQPSKTFSKDSLSFDYPDSWTVTDDSNSDANQFTLAKTNSDVQIRGFIHKGRISPEQLPEAKQKFIDPYIAATAKQFVQMGAKPEQVPDASEIGGVKADGVSINASLGGETGAAKIYWALIGQRVVVLTLFGPDKELKQHAPVWDLVRTSFKISDPKATPSPKTSP